MAVKTVVMDRPIEGSCCLTWDFGVKTVENRGDM